MGTGMGTQAGSLLPFPPCSASATILPLQRALCSRRTRTARVCSPSWSLVPTGLSRCGSRQDGDTCRQLPVPCIVSPSPAFWLQQRCWGQGSQKTWRQSNLLPEQSLPGAGAGAWHLTGDPRAQDGAPPFDRAPQGRCTGGFAHLMAVLQQRQSSGKGKESRESQWPSWPPPGYPACPSRPSRALGSRRRQGGSQHGCWSSADPKLCSPSMPQAPRLFCEGQGTAKPGCLCLRGGDRALPARAAGCGSTGSCPCPRRRQRQPSALQQPPACVRVGGRVPGPRGGQRPLCNTGSGRSCPVGEASCGSSQRRVG